MPKALIHGPRLQNEATLHFQKIVKKMLRGFYKQKQMRVAYEEDNLVIYLNNYRYPLTALLEAGVQWDQLEFDRLDRSYYNYFLSCESTKYRHIQLNKVNDDGSLVNFNRIKQCYPKLRLEECSAIRNLTCEFYQLVNLFLRSHGKARFIWPLPQGSSDEFKDALSQFVTLDVLDLNQLIFEIIVHSAIAISALTKPIQNSLSLFLTPSLDILAMDLATIEGQAAVLVGRKDQKNLVFVVDGKIIDPLLPSFSVENFLHAALLQENEQDLTKFTQAEIDLLIAELNPADFHEEFSLQPFKARLLAQLSIQMAEAFNHPIEILYRVEGLKGPFSKYVDTIRADLQKHQLSSQNIQGFYSSSTQILTQFADNNPLVITKIYAPLGTARNISVLSKWPREEERLFSHGQTFEFFSSRQKQEALELEARPVRGLGYADKPSSLNWSRLFGVGLIATTAAVLYHQQYKNP